MKNNLHNLIRFLLVLALLATSAIALAQDEMAAASDAPTMPFIGVRYWSADTGILVTGIVPNSPAASANLEPGDHISALDEQAIDSASIKEVLFAYDAGDTISLSVERDGATFTTDVTLVVRPEDLFSNPDYALPLDLAAVGLYAHQCQDKVYIVAALAGSQVAEAGFQRYDRLIGVDGDAIDSIGAADLAVSDLNEGDELAFTVLRGDRELTMKVSVEDQRKRRNPRHRPRPRPRLTEYNKGVYETSNIKLHYADTLIEVNKLGEDHEWYASGLRQFDLISAANGAPLAEANGYFASDMIRLTVERGDSALHFDVASSTAPLLLFGLDTPESQDRSDWLGLHEKQVTLGVRYIQLEADSPYFEGSEIRSGAYVADVIEGLPAGAAGIQIGDIILAVEGKPATLEVDLRNRIYFHKPGDTVTLDILRDGEVFLVDVALRVAS